MGMTRRRLLRLLSAAAVLPLAELLPLPARAGTGGPREGFYLVNGWILTAADLRALGIEDAPRLG